MFRCMLCALLCLCVSGFAAEENFLLIDGATNEVLREMGPHLEERVTPCSTFKIPISLMGFDAGILQSDESPVWNFEEGDADDLEEWKAPHDPWLWMQHSCVWYSQKVVQQLGLELTMRYLSLFDYGNQDFSGGLKRAWISSSLKISPREQVAFLHKLVDGRLPISHEAMELTKAILFKEELPGGWKLYGKTGYGSISMDEKVGWFVGWIENEGRFLLFSYHIRDHQIALEKRVPRAKDLINNYY